MHNAFYHLVFNFLHLLITRPSPKARVESYIVKCSRFVVSFSWCLEMLIGCKLAFLDVDWLRIRTLETLIGLCSVCEVHVPLKISHGEMRN